MKMAILILNYNGAHFLPQCLQALTQQTDQDFDVWLINNGSHDDSAHVATREYPGIQIYTIEKNAGFTGGYNQAFRHLTSQPYSYDYFLLLSNDAFCDRDVIAEFRKTVTRFPDLALFQPAIVDANNTTDLCIGTFSLWTGRCPGHLHHAPYQKANAFYRGFWACGAAVFVRVRDLQEVSFFDNYFAYFEDIGLGWKLSNRGKLILGGMNAKVLHIGSGTFKGSPYTFYLIERNRVLAFHQNLTPLMFWLLIVLVVPCRVACLIGLLFLRRVQWPAIQQGLKGIRDGFCQKHNFPRHTTSLRADLKALVGAGRVRRVPMCE